MASLTPRASESGFWTDATMATDYFPEDGLDVEQQLLLEVNDGRTPVRVYTLRQKRVKY
jgi:hypothetical protein